jgi:hypothetical protein
LQRLSSFFRVYIRHTLIIFQAAANAIATAFFAASLNFPEHSKVSGHSPLKQEVRMKMKLLTIAAAGAFLWPAALLAEGPSAQSPGHEMQGEGSAKGSPGASGYSPGHEMQEQGGKGGSPGREARNKGDRDRDDMGDRDDKDRGSSMRDKDDRDRDSMRDRDRDRDSDRHL